MTATVLAPQFKVLHWRIEKSNNMPIGNIAVTKSSKLPAFVGSLVSLGECCPALQVPFIKWLGDIPIAGGPVGGLVGSLAGPYAKVFMGRTGQQLFLQDSSARGPPLLVGPANAATFETSQNAQCA